MLSRNELLKNKKIFSCVQFLKSKGVSKIYLFGSYAKGNANINSDFDFGVIGLDPNLFFSTWYELERISKKHIDLSLLMVKKCTIQEPDYYDLCAISSMIHSFYNGLENIFKLIAKNCDNQNFSGGQSYSDLLENMFSKTDKRSPIFSKSLKPIFINYLEKFINNYVHN